MQADLLREIASLGNSGDFGEVPTLPLVVIGDPNDRTVPFDGQQIEHAILVGIGHSHCLNRRQTGRQRAFAELALPLIHKNMKSSLRVNDRGIGIAVSVEISPGKAAQARDSGEGMNIGEGSVAVVS